MAGCGEDSDTFDRAIITFPDAHVGQNNRDYEAFVAAVRQDLIGSTTEF